MIRTLLLLGALSAVGLTAWTSAPEPAAPSMAFDSAHWASLINAITDPTTGMVSRDSARGDSLLLFPGAVGWGAEAHSCQDSLRAGSGSIKVWKVTASTGTGAGTWRAALDSMQVYDDASTCQYIIWPSGGNFSFDETGSPDYDDTQNWGYFGQTAQGGGVNMLSGAPRYRGAQYLRAEYLMSYRPDAAVHSPWSGSAETMCIRNGYWRNITVGFGGSSSGRNQFGIYCGTTVVKMLGDTTKNHTIQAMLLGEPGDLRPEHFSAGSDSARRVVNVLLTEMYMHGSGWRGPNLGAIYNGGLYNSVNYNSTNYAAAPGREVDFIDIYTRPGPMTNAASRETNAWSVQIQNVNAIPDFDSLVLYFEGLRSQYNDYELDPTVDSLVRGSKRTVSCDDDFTLDPGWCAVGGDSIPLATDNVTVIDTARATAHSATETVLRSTSFTDTAVAEVIRLAGNVRYLACDGQWTFRSDSIASRWRQEWIDSTDAGDHSSSGGVADGTRTYGVPAAGTTCTDSDDDGLPNAYETAQVGSTTALAVDSMSYNRPAIEWYLDGRNLDGTLVGCEDLSCEAEAGGGAISPTFGAVNRYVYFVPMQTIFGLSFPDSIPLTDIRFARENSAGDSAMVVTCTATGTPADSATVESRLSAWGLTTLASAVAVRDHDPFPGMGC